MTNLQEAEAGARSGDLLRDMALVTDYDVWHDTEEDVSVESVVAILRQKCGHRARHPACGRDEDPSGAKLPLRHALRDAIITSPESIPENVKRDLAPIVGKYVKA